MKKWRCISPRKVTSLPWRLEIEFDDTPSCKLYSQLSFCDEDEEFTAPAVSPVESCKYAALVKHNKDGYFTSTEDIIDNSFQLHNRLVTYDKSSNKFAEDRKSEVRCNLSSSHMSKQGKIKNQADNSKAVRSFSSKSSKEERLDNECREFSSSNIVYNNRKSYIDAHTNSYTLLEQPKSTTNGSVTENHEIETTAKESDFLRQERDITSKLWQCALLANRSSNPCSSPVLNDDEANRIRYRPERHTFLRKSNTFRNYKRTIRLRSSAMLLEPRASTSYS